MLLLVLSLLTLSGVTSTIVPPNFGPKGIYQCKCGEHCNPKTGVCPESNQMCSDGSQYGQILNNCQIESLARGKVAHQPSIQSGHGAAGVAVDGRAYYKGEFAGCSHTAFSNVCKKSSPVSWWQVNLQDVKEISAVWILNLENSHHLANIVVRVSNKEDDWEHADICYSFSDPPADPWHRQLCDKPLRGQYVRIEKTACTQGSWRPVPFLILCEVLVIDKLYIAASDVSVTSSTMKFSVNEMFYGGIVTYKTSLIGRGSHGCSRLEKPISQDGVFSSKQMELADLSSYWDYEMRIQPVVGTMSYGPSTDFSFTTTGDKPAKAPSGLGAIPLSSRSVRLQWDALKCSDWRDRKKDYKVEILTKFTDTVQGANVLVNTLEPWTSYTARVKSVNSYGESDWTTHEFRTKPDIPTAPRNAQTDGYTDTSVKLKWTAPEHHYGPPGEYQVTILNLNTTTMESRNVSGTSTEIKGLTAGVEFTFSVKASTIGAGQGLPSNTVKQYTKPPSPPHFETKVYVDADGVKLFLPGLKSRRFFIAYIVLVDKQTSVRRRSVSSYCNEASSSAYITANLTNIPDAGLNFTVGDNRTSNGVVNRPLSTGGHTIYVVAINRFRTDESYTCTSNDFTTSKVVSKPTSQPGRESPGGVIGGAIGGVVAVLAASVVIVFFLLRRRRELAKREVPENGYCEVQLEAVDDLDHTTENHNKPLSTPPKPTVRPKPNPATTPKPRPTTNPKPILKTRKPSATSLAKPLTKPTVSQKPTAPLYANDPNTRSLDKPVVKLAPKPTGGIPKDDLKSYIQRMKNTDEGFQQAFSRMKSEADKSHSIGEALERKRKNRFRNITPYDVNRVILQDLPDDYINASPITAYTQSQRYIAAQAPTEFSLVDFIHMIYQEKIEVMVMLNQVMENGKMRCEPYWSDSQQRPLVTRRYTVHTVQETNHRYYVIRKLKIVRKEDESSRTVVQYHFTSWPDKGVPTVGAGLLHLAAAIKQRNTDIPLLVHCTAGVGRTGTFIALDILLSQERYCIDECIQLLREQRMNMVQTKSQYEFLHELLLENITCGCQPMSVNEHLDWLNQDVYSQQLDALYDVLSLTTSGKHTVDEDVEADQYRTTTSIFIGCTVHLLRFATTSSSHVMASLLRRAVEFQPEVVVVVCSSQQEFLKFGSTDAIYSNEKALVYDDLTIDQSEAVIVSPDLTVTEVTISSVKQEDVYANSTASAAGNELSWRGRVLRLATDDIGDVTTARALQQLNSYNTVAVVYENTSEELMSTVCLSFYAVTSVQKYQEVDLYSSAKQLIYNYQLPISKKSFEISQTVLQKYLQQ